MKNIFLFIVLVNLFFFPLSATGQSFSADDGSDPIEWKQLPPSIISKAILSRSNKDFEMLTNIVDLQLDGASATFSGNLITLHNLKILSDTTDFDDYISIDYLMDTETLQLIPAHIEITDDLGVYYRDESLFSKDVSIALEMKTTTGDLLVPDTLHNISTSAADEFTMFIEIGTVLTMQVKDPTDDLIIEISKPDGSLYGRNLYRSGSWWYTWGKSFIEPTHKPKNSASPRETYIRNLTAKHQNFRLETVSAAKWGKIGWKRLTEAEYRNRYPF